MQYIPPEFTRGGMELAGFFGMRIMDPFDLLGGVDTLCIAMSDLVGRVFLEEKASSDSRKVDACVDMLNRIVLQFEPKRLIIAFRGPVVLQQIHMERVRAGVQERIHLDMPGMPSTQLLDERVRKWVESNSCSAEIYLSDAHVPGDGLFKIRQTLRYLGFGGNTIIYGRNNPHVLSCLALGDGVVHLVYEQLSDGKMYFMRSPKNVSQESFRYLVAYDFTFLPDPPPNMVYGAIEHEHVQSYYDSGDVTVSSYEEYLLYLRGKEPQDNKSSAYSYLKVVNMLYYYYTQGKVDNTLLYLRPYYPQCEIRLPDISSEIADDLDDDLGVLPTSMQLMLIAPKVRSAELPANVAFVVERLPPFPARLPLKRLLELQDAAPSKFAADMMVQSALSIYRHDSENTADLIQKRKVLQLSIADRIPTCGELILEE